MASSREQQHGRQKHVDALGRAEFGGGFEGRSVELVSRRRLEESVWGDFEFLQNNVDGRYEMSSLMLFSHSSARCCVLKRIYLRERLIYVYFFVCSIALIMVKAITIGFIATKPSILISNKGEVLNRFKNIFR